MNGDKLEHPHLKVHLQARRRRLTDSQRSDVSSRLIMIIARQTNRIQRTPEITRGYVFVGHTQTHSDTFRPIRAQFGRSDSKAEEASGCNYGESQMAAAGGMAL